MRNTLFLFLFVFRSFMYIVYLLNVGTGELLFRLPRMFNYIYDFITHYVITTRQIINKEPLLNVLK